MKQAGKILDEMVSNEETIPLLSPHFSPVQVDTPVKFVQMYQKVVDMVSCDHERKNDPDVLFVLLTKVQLNF